MKTVYYSYLLNREKSLRKALVSGNDWASVLHKTKAAALRAREIDCADGENKPGPLVRVTLETAWESE